jgi:hypothetical protein
LRAPCNQGKVTYLLMRTIVMQDHEQQTDEI